MLQQLADEARRQPREAIYVQVARNMRTCPFGNEVDTYRCRSIQVLSYAIVVFRIKRATGILSLLTNLWLC